MSWLRPLNSAQGAVGTLCSKGTLLARAQLMSAKAPSPSLQSRSQQGRPQTVPLYESFLPGDSAWCLSLPNCPSCWPVPSACVGPSEWQSCPQVCTCSSKWVSSANVTTVHSIASFRSLMKVLSRKSPSMAPCGTPLLTDLQVEQNLVMTSLWAWSSEQ